MINKDRIKYAQSLMPLAQ